MDVLAISLLTVFFAIWIGFAIIGFKKKWSGIVSIGGGFFVSCASFAVLGTIYASITDQVSELYAPSGTVSTISSSTPTLASVAAGCSIENASGSKVGFAETSIPDSINVDANSLCAKVDQIVKRYLVDARKGIDSAFCNHTDDFVREIGGGSYQRAIDKVSSWQQDSQTLATLKIMKLCRSEESRSQSARESVVDINIYSVGTFNPEGRSCIGLLVEISARTSLQSRAYELKGLNECADFSVNMESESIFHPEVRPNGVPYGDYIVNSYKFNGDMPNTYLYKNRQYSFFTGSQKSIANATIKSHQETNTSNALSIVKVEEQISEIERIARQLESSSRPTCNHLANVLRNSNPGAEDSILRTAEKYGCNF